MEAKSITTLSLWFGITEWDIFHGAYFWWYSVGEARAVDGYVADFHQKGEIPNFVHAYLVGVIFPRIVIKGGLHEDKPEKWVNKDRF